jgi:hypothetical protein
MPLSVQIEDESGRRAAERWWHPRSTQLLVGAHPGTCCLRFLDPYGDTVFNQEQLPVLLAELRALRQRAPDPEGATMLDDLLRYLEAATEQVHTYVRFVGD